MGIGIGVAVSFMFKHSRSAGNLRIDTSDPDGPYIFLELNNDISSISSQKAIVLKIKNENYITQK